MAARIRKFVKAVKKGGRAISRGCARVCGCLCLCALFLLKNVFETVLLVCGIAIVCACYPVYFVGVCCYALVLAAFC
jgi:glucan phosphoethanolaminetransferase (alkaline phosphatase superfamily)